MYDFPATREANDAFWTLIRRNLGFGPERLCRDGEVWRHWCAPDLILSQTCGLPFRARLSDRVALVGTPDYGLPGCAPGHYFSVILVRGDLGSVDPADSPGMRLACNDALSQSGWAAAHAHAADHGAAFETVLSTGSHHASATAVAEGRADIAFVDAVTWRHIGADPLFRDLAVIGRTAPTPGLPLITARSEDAGPVAGAVEAALEAAGPELRAQIGIQGLIQIPAASYLSQPVPPPPPQ